MSRLAQFDRPAPILQTSVDEVSIEASGGAQGRFFVTNGGGGELKGDIASNSRALSFSPESFEGDAEITYTFVPDFYRKGDLLRTDAVILSNGGEAVIPFQIRVTPPALNAADGAALSSLEEFAAFAAANPIEARRLFARWEFADWLSRLGYGHMELYERFALDTNKERALDSFLVLSGLRPRMRVTAEAESVALYAAEGDAEPLTGALGFARSRAGYVNMRVSVTRGGEWLSLDKERLTGADFDADGRAEALFMAMPGRAEAFAAAAVRAETDTEPPMEITVTLAKRPRITAATDRPSYAYEDRGVIHIKNGTGGPLELDITARDACVRPEADRVRFGEAADVRFTTRVPLLTRFALRGQPYIETAIEIQGGAGFRKTLKIRVGGYM